MLHLEFELGFVIEKGNWSTNQTSGQKWTGHQQLFRWIYKNVANWFTSHHPKKCRGDIPGTSTIKALCNGLFSWLIDILWRPSVQQI